MSVPPGKFYRRDLYEPITRLTGAWSGVIDYVPGDIVSTSAGVMYICITANRNFTPPNTAYWLPTGPSAQKYGTLIDIVSSTSETDILQSAGYTIPGNTMGALGRARVTINGDLLNNTGSTATLTGRIYFGGTKIYQDAMNIGTAASPRMDFVLRFDIINRNATNSQRLTGNMILNTNGVGVVTTGQGQMFNQNGTPTWGGAFSTGAADPAKDTTLSQLLRVTMQWSASNANLSLRAYDSLIEFL